MMTDAQHLCTIGLLWHKCRYKNTEFDELFGMVLILKSLNKYHI